MSMQYSILGNRPLDQWKVTELRDELRRRKIVTSGVKAELVKRLDEAVREEFDNGLNPDSDNQDDSHEHEMEFHEDNKEYNSNRSESIDDSIKTISENAETRDKDSTMVDSDDTNAITGQGNTAQVGESEMVDVDDSNAITGQGNGDQAGGLLGTSDSDGPGNLHEDNKDDKDNNSNRSEFTDDSIKTIPENAERRDEDSAMADSDDKNAFTGQGITAQVGEPTMVDADYKNAVTGEGNIVQDDGPLGSFDSDGVADQTVILADTVENSIAIKQSELTGLGKEEPMDDRAVITNKGSEPTLEIAELAVFNPNNQVSKVDPVSGFQFKCESISTDSAKFNEKFELKDSLNTDNFHLEVEVVKPDTLHPLSGDAPPNDGDLHQSADQEPGGNLSHVEEIDDTNAANIELSKKNDSADGASSEKLNLDRSSGDDSLEDEGLESKQIDSVHYCNEAGDENQNVDLRPVKEESPIDSMIEGLSPEKKGNIAENNDLSISAGKRKTEDQAVVINEPSKRHRRWFSQPLKVSESETSHPASLSTPREKFNSVPKRVLAKSDSNLSIDSPKEQIVPQSQKPATNSLRIDRFLRPFTLKAVQELLAKTGTVSSFWMDHIKTHCYVTYSSVEEAVGTRNALYNQQWPPNGGHLLIAEFVDPQEVKARVEAQQAPVPAAAAPSCSQSQPSPRQHGVQQQLPPPPPTREYLRQLPPPPARKPEPPTVTLDDLFRKTRATPRIYWLPHSEEQVTAKLARQSRESRS